MDYPKSMYKTLLTDAVGAGGALETGKVHLIKQPIAPGPNTVLADFTAIECDYAGYAAAAIGAWGGVGINASGQAEVTATELEFHPTDDVTPNTVWGEFFTNTAGTVLLGWRILSAGVPLVDADSYYRTVTRVALPADAN